MNQKQNTSSSVRFGVRSSNTIRRNNIKRVNLGRASNVNCKTKEAKLAAKTTVELGLAEQGLRMVREARHPARAGCPCYRCIDWNEPTKFSKKVDLYKEIRFQLEHRD